MSHLLQKHEPRVTYSKRKRQLLKNMSRPFLSHLVDNLPLHTPPMFFSNHSHTNFLYPTHLSLTLSLFLKNKAHKPYI